MKYLIVVLAAVVLSSCALSRRTEAFHAQCRLEGYAQGTQDFNDCVTVKRHNWRYDVSSSGNNPYVSMGNSMQSLGNSLIQQGSPSYAPAPTVAKPQTFCYPTAYGYTYCQ